MRRPDFSSRAFDVLDVLEVHDGDTFALLLDVGFRSYAAPWLRLKGYSCPELGTELGEQAHSAAFTLLHANLATMWIVTTKVPLDLLAKEQHRYGDSPRSFARYVAEVWLDDDRSLGAELTTRGLAVLGARVG